MATGMFTALTDALGDAAAGVAERVRRGTVEVRGPAGHGSGTIWREDGLIVTNHHVARGHRYRVIVSEGSEYDGEVVARDPEHDLAALRVPATGLPALVSADSDNLRAGQLALVAGNPWGQRGHLTAGVVIGRSAGGDGHIPLPEAIRADIRLAPGNSGGPMVDAGGRVIGVNSMIVNGMAIAIPSNKVERFLVAALAPQPLGLLGVVLTPVALPSRMAEGLKAGLMVTDVADNTAASRAGIIPGDIVVAVDGHEGVAGVASRLRRLEANAPLTITILRAGRIRTIETVPLPVAA